MPSRRNRSNASSAKITDNNGQQITWRPRHNQETSTAPLQSTDNFEVKAPRKKQSKTAKQQKKPYKPVPVQNRQCSEAIVMSSRFSRNPKYQFIYREAPQDNPKSPINRVPYEVWKQIFGYLVGDTQTILNLAATCQHLFAHTMDSVTVWDFRIGLFGKAWDTSIKKPTTDIGRHTVMEISSSRNPEWKDVKMYECLHLVKMTLSCINYGARIRHLEINRVPFVSYQVIKFLLPQMPALEFLRLEYLPLLDVTHTPGLMSMCAAADISGRKTNVDLDFRPFFKTVNGVYKTCCTADFLFPAACVLAIFLPRAHERGLTLAKTSSSFYNTFASMSDEPYIGGVRLKGINPKIWKKFCLGQLDGPLISWLMALPNMNALPPSTPDLSKIVECKRHTHSLHRWKIDLPLAMMTQTSVETQWPICHSCYLFESLAWDHNLPSHLRDRLTNADILIGLQREEWQTIDDPTARTWLEHSLGRLRKDLDTNPTYKIETWQQVTDRESAEHYEQLRKMHVSKRDRRRKTSKKELVEWKTVKAKRYDHYDRFNTDVDYDRKLLGEERYEEWDHHKEKFDLAKRNPIPEDLKMKYTINEDGIEVDDVGKPRGYW